MMTEEKLAEIQDTHRLQKVLLRSNQRGVGGLVTHFNVTASAGESPTNFNVNLNDVSLVKSITEWASREGVLVERELPEGLSDTLMPVNGATMPPTNTAIWRYMDLSKFVALLKDRALWFARLDKNWEVDSMEGQVPKRLLQHSINRIRNTQWAPRYVGEKSCQFGGLPKQGMRQLTHEEICEPEIDGLKARNDAAKYNSYIHCWNVDDHETYHMWKLYSGHHNGVAIKTTLGRLIESLGESCDYQISGGLVQYLDFDEDIPEGLDNVFTNVFCKTQPYKHESEFRLMFHDHDHDHGQVNPLLPADVPYSFDGRDIESVLPRYRPGFNVPVNLEVLIDQVVISPEADTWFKGVVESVLKQYKIKPNKKGVYQ